jgi:hypothetical protein
VGQFSSRPWAPLSEAIDMPSLSTSTLMSYNIGHSRHMIEVGVLFHVLGSSEYSYPHIVYSMSQNRLLRYGLCIAMHNSLVPT